MSSLFEFICFESLQSYYSLSFQIQSTQIFKAAQTLTFKTNSFLSFSVSWRVSSAAVKMRCRIFTPPLYNLKGLLVFFLRCLEIWPVCVCVWSCVCICGCGQSPAAKRPCPGCAFRPQWLASIRPLSSPPCSGSTGQEVSAWGAFLFNLFSHLRLPDWTFTELTVTEKCYTHQVLFFMLYTSTFMHKDKTK